MADRPDFAQDRQLCRRLQQSMHCRAVHDRHTVQRNQSFRFFSTNDSVCGVSNFCLEILSKNISHCNVFSCLNNFIDVYLLVKTAFLMTSNLRHYYVVLCK